MASPQDFIVQPVNALGAYLGGVQAKQQQVQGQEQNALLKLQQQYTMEQRNALQQKGQMDAEDARRKQHLDILTRLGEATKNIGAIPDPQAKAHLWGQIVEQHRPIYGDMVDRFKDPSTIPAVAAMVEQEVAKYGAPVAGVGADGKPEFRQFDQSGRSRPVEGFAPAPKEPLVKVDTGTKQEGEESKTVGKYFGEAFGKIQDMGMAAHKEIANLDRVDTLLASVQTGAFKGTTQDLKKKAKALGVDLDQFGVTDDTAPVDAATSIINQMALSLRNPESGLGMPGSLSERDLKFLQDSVPGLEQTPEGRKELIKYQKALAKRRVDIAKLAREYRRANGSLNEGFYDEVERYAESNPLFDGAPATPAPKGATDPLSGLKERAARGDKQAQAFLKSQGL